MREHRQAFYEVTEKAGAWLWIALASDRVSMLGRGEAASEVLGERLAKACIEAWEQGY